MYDTTAGVKSDTTAGVIYYMLIFGHFSIRYSNYRAASLEAPGGQLSPPDGATCIFLITWVFTLNMHVHI